MALFDASPRKGTKGHTCLVGLRAEVTGQPREETRPLGRGLISHQGRAVVARAVGPSEDWEGSGVRLPSSCRPQGKGCVLEVSWPDPSLVRSRLQITGGQTHSTVRPGFVILAAEQSLLRKSSCHFLTCYLVLCERGKGGAASQVLG